MRADLPVSYTHLAQVGMGEFRNHLIGALSGGQFQRVLVALSLIHISNRPAAMQQGEDRRAPQAKEKTPNKKVKKAPKKEAERRKDTLKDKKALYLSRSLLKVAHRTV